MINGFALLYIEGTIRRRHLQMPLWEWPVSGERRLKALNSLRKKEPHVTAFKCYHKLPKDEMGCFRTNNWK